MVSMNFYVVTIDISVSVPPLSRALFPRLGEVSVKCLSPEVDSLFDIGACCISLASQVLLVLEP
jgi:hypothetical protein